MKTINFVVRTSAGAVERGILASDSKNPTVFVGSGKEVSLNLNPQDLLGYSRDGDALQITLADGRVITLEGYFAEDGASLGNRLFISANSELSEITFTEGADGVLFANYGPTEVWGKWSPSDDLIFVEEPEVIAMSPVQGGPDDEVSMLAAAPLLGGAFGGGSALAAGAAVAGGAAVIAGGGGTTPGQPAVAEGPTVDDTPVALGGDGVPENGTSVAVNGTGVPGSNVSVTIDGKTETTTVNPDGTWTTTFEGDNFPSDGTHTSEVTVTDPNGVTTDLTGPTVVVDTTPPAIDVTDGAVSTDDLVNAASYENGVALTGSGEPGATMTVEVEGASATTTVGEDGTWTVNFSQDQVAGGEYDATVTITASDAAGNTTVVTDTVHIDTVPHPLNVAASSVEADGVINAVELQDGYTVSGTSTAGATVTVTINGQSADVVVDENGNWSANFDASTLPAGEYDAEVKATTVDAAGNSSSTTGTIRVDTIGNVAFSATAIEGDNVINSVEAADGFVATGTTQPGSTVTVTFGTTTVNATVGANGAWSATFPASSIEPGEYETTMTVNATDAAGNTSSASKVVNVDTITSAAFDSGLAGGDDFINALEAQNGVNLTGTAQPNAQITVEFGGSSYTATANGTGEWSVSVPSSAIEPGAYEATATVTAVDQAGNSASATHVINVDTLAGVTINTGMAVETDGIVNKVERADGVTLTGTTLPGSTVNVTVGNVTHAATVANDGSWTVDFAASEIPTGTYTANATVNATSPAGNVSTAQGTFQVDTEGRVAISTAPVASDDIINAAERSAGVTLTGTSEPGSTVSVTMGAVTKTATVQSNGNWTANFGSGDIPEGTETLNVTATATDRAGNVTTATDTVKLDTVANVAIDGDTIADDGIINAAERGAGVTLTGNTEPGSSVMVSMNGYTHAATVDANGAWSVDFPASEIPTGERSVTVTATATDTAGNTSSATDDIDVDTLVRNFSVGTLPGGADQVINASEAAQGFVLTGQSEPGSTVMVKFGTLERPATVAENGSWTVTFAATDIPSGDVTVPLVVRATDAAGNQDTITKSVHVDTDAGRLTIDPLQGGADDTVNYAESQDGMVVSGQADPNAIVKVRLGDGAEHTVVSNASGVWTTTFVTSEITPGTYDQTITATTTDAAGNSRTVTDTVHIDTQVDNFALGPSPISVANGVNNTEAAAGLVLTGTTEAGSTVQITMNGKNYTATVDVNGNWSVNVPGADIKSGEYDESVKVTTTDHVGNVSETTTSIKIDTVVNNLTANAMVEADGTVNAAELRNGVPLTGTVEAGSNVVIVYKGVEYPATVSASGQWSANLPASAIAGGDYTANYSVHATDAAGNTRIENAEFHVDTIAPDGTIVQAVNFERFGDIRDIAILDTPNDFKIMQENTDGSISQVSGTTHEGIVTSETSILFDSKIPDGSNLIMLETDAAGNKTGTYLVVSEAGGADVSVANPALGANEITAIDLSFAENAHLTLTEAQIKALSAQSDQVVVYGAGDDSVTMIGAEKTGTTVGRDGETYNIYTLGDAQVLIDEDITNITI